MMKVDELRLTGVAYWAQNHITDNRPRHCTHAGADELVAFARETPLHAVLVTKQSPTVPKGSPPGRTFVPWSASNASKPRPIDIGVVYTEAGKRTLAFGRLLAVAGEPTMDLRRVHVHCSLDADRKRSESYRGKLLPYRPSLFGGVSLVKIGDPDLCTDIKPLRPESATRTIAAIARMHPDVCGRVTA